MDKYAAARAAVADGLWTVDADSGTVTRLGYGPTGHVNKRGYVVLSTPTKPHMQVRAHRVIYEAVYGPIPAGLTINHKNGVKTDNRIGNLEAVTPLENVRHAIRTGLRWGGATCKHGHAYDEANTYIDKRRGWKQCRTCQQERSARHTAA